MRDTEVVASIVAGDPEGLAEAYDRYADALYSYCRSLLREPADAADAVQDTFVIAASKLTRLRDPERLRAWLFAVARNECMHKLRSRPAAALQDIPDQIDDSADVSARAEREEARALMRAAVGGLNDGERDVINQLWHGLEVPEVAAVLGVSRNHAYSLFSRAREQLEASVAVLVVGRSGRKDCATLDRLLSGWDGRLTATLRKRVGRHIDRCLICSSRRRQELEPALLLSLTPAAVLAIAASKDPVRVLAGAAARLSGPPPGLRAAVLRLTPSSGSHPVMLHGGMGGSTRSFGLSGFPKPLHHGHVGLASVPHLSLSVVSGTAVAATAATATVVVTAVGPYAHHGPPAPGAATAAMAPASSTSRSVAPQAGAGQAPSTGAGSATRRSRRATPSRQRDGSSGPASSPATSATAPAATGATTPAATGGSPTATSTGTATATATATATVTPTLSEPPGAGTLTAAPAAVVLSPLSGGTLTLTANGGPVNWSISEPASLIGTLTISPTSGTVYPGSPVTVTVMAAAVSSLHTTLTISPGDQAVAVQLGLGL